MNYLTLLAVLFSFNIVFAGGAEGTGGGDQCEARIQEIRDDISWWIDQGAQHKESFGRDGHLTYQRLNLLHVDYPSYFTNMTDAIEEASIYCVSEGDKYWPVEVNGEPKECKFIKNDTGSKIICDAAKFRALSEDLQYRQVHHEYAGLAGVEIPDGAKSDYHVSNQLMAFLEIEVNRKLSIQKNTIIGANHGKRSIETLPFNARVKFVMNQIIPSGTDHIVLGRLEKKEQTIACFLQFREAYYDRHFSGELLLTNFTLSGDHSYGSSSKRRNHFLRPSIAIMNRKNLVKYGFKIYCYKERGSYQDSLETVKLGDFEKVIALSSGWLVMPAAQKL